MRKKFYLTVFFPYVMIMQDKNWFGSISCGIIGLF